MAPITSRWSWVPFLTSIDVHRYRVTQSWVNLSCWRNPEETLLNGTEGSGCRTGGSGCGGLVSQFEGLICHTVLVYIFSCVIPVFWGSIRWTSIGHCCDGVLDLGIQSLLELHHSGFRVSVKYGKNWKGKEGNVGDWGQTVGKHVGIGITGRVGLSVFTTEFRTWLQRVCCALAC